MDLTSLTPEQCQMHKRAYLKGALTQMRIMGKTQDAIKPVLEKLAKVHDSAVTKQKAVRAALKN
jgi:hypothetical protein